ncbi:MAG: hypothetical protein LBJ82_00965 [Deltaproteobacteria bacterium]|jgi:hypothetical protein|nr:hypothetical protein [Deltaproteobacteria bacterium]
MRPIAIRLDQRTRDGLELLSRVTGTSCAEHAALALRSYVQERLEDLAAGKILPAGTDSEETPVSPERWDLLV